MENFFNKRLDILLKSIVKMKYCGNIVNIQLLLEDRRWKRRKSNHHSCHKSLNLSGIPSPCHIRNIVIEIWTIFPMQYWKIFVGYQKYFSNLASCISLKKQVGKYQRGIIMVVNSSLSISVKYCCTVLH